MRISFPPKKSQTAGPAPAPYPAPTSNNGHSDVNEIVANALPAKAYRDKKVLLIIPDATRTAPVGLLFKTIFEQIGEVTKNLDILVALGTHQPMSEEAICQRLDISTEEHRNKFSKVRF